MDHIIDAISDKIPNHIISIVSAIENQGFHAYVVGGAIRDLILGRVPIEFDLASDATPDDIINMFPKVTPIGKLFGTVAIHFENHIVEVTTFRLEGIYEDSRHPSHVEFTKNIHDDLSRRDFTVNALAYHPIRQEIIDNYSGLDHLENRRLVCVGDPVQRLTEDPLRAFRCFRFMSQMGFIISSDILAALQSLASTVVLPSIPRIRREMNRLLLGHYWLSALKLMHESNWLQRLISDYPKYETIELHHDLLFRWAWLFSKSSVDKTAQLFQFSKSDITKIKEIIAWEYNPDAVNLTIDDLNITSQELMAMGFKGKTLGLIQKKILFQIRSENLHNSNHDILQYLSNEHPD